MASAVIGSYNTSLFNISATVQESSTSGYSRNVTVIIYMMRKDYTSGTDVRYTVNGDISNSGSFASYSSPVEIARGTLNVTVNDSGYASVNISIEGNFTSSSAGYKSTSTTITGLNLTPPSSGGGGGGGTTEPDEPEEETYTITLDRNGYTWDSFPSRTTYTKTEGKSLSLSKPSRNNTTKSGTAFTITGNANGGDSNTSLSVTPSILTSYTFDGWEDGETNQIWNTSFTGDYDTTLYALQSHSDTTTYSNNTLSLLDTPTRSDGEEKYTVTYDGNGGTPSKTSDTATRVVKYSFNHWNSKNDGSGTKYNDDSEFTSKTTVYAMWTVASDTTTSVKLPTATRNGYTFVGWAESTNSDYFITNNYTPESDITLYAQWASKDDIPYVVNHHIQDLGSSVYSVYESSSRLGITDETITIYNLQMSIEGFTFKEGKVNGSVVSSTTVRSDGNLVIDLYYTRNKYSVTLVTTPEVESLSGAGSYEYGATVSIRAVILDSRIYHLNEWTGSTLTLTDNPAVFTMPAQSLTLTPNITLNTYKIEFDGNGDDGSGYVASMQMVYGTAKALNLNEFIKPGFVFDHWNRNADDSGMSYTDGQSVKNLTTEHRATVTLYAIWKGTNYTITYNAPGATNVPSSANKEYGETYTISNTIPEKPGYEFQGWSRTDGGTVDFSPGSSYTENDSLVLYAVWKVQTYTITYNASGATNVPSSATKEYGKTYTISNMVPEKTGFIFQGWSRTDGGTVDFNPGSSYTENAPLTLYAVWGGTSYNIIYYADGANNVPPNGTKKYNEPYTISTMVPTKSGHEFQGWSKTNGGSVNFTPGSSYTENAPLTLYAVWKTGMYTNTINHVLRGFVKNDGNFNNGQCFLVESETFTQEYRTSFSITTTHVLDNIPKGFKLNNVVDYINNNNMTSTFTLGTQLNQIESDMIFNIYYDPIDYNINYNLNGGSNFEDAPSTYNILYGVTFEDATKTGSKFSGWTDHNNSIITGVNEGKTARFTSTDAMYSELASRTIGNISIKANWSALGAVSIVDSNGNIDNYQCFIYHDGEWHLYAPYIVSDGAWDAY